MPVSACFTNFWHGRRFCSRHNMLVAVIHGTLDVVKNVRNEAAGFGSWNTTKPRMNGAYPLCMFWI